MSAEIEIDDIIDRYLEHPEDPDAVATARSPEVFVAFIWRCLAAIDSDPSEGLPMLNLAFRIATSACDVVQVFGLRAGAYRLQGRVTKALAILEDFRETACGSCRAHILRQRAKSLAALSLTTEALSEADAQVQASHDLQIDHDPHGNGFVSALLARADIRYFIGSQSQDAPLLSGAVADVETALGLIVPRETPKLYNLALFNLAVALYATGNPEDLARSYDCLCQARRRMSSGKPSQERGKLAWVSAMVEHELIAHRRVLPRETVLDMNRRGVRPVHVRQKLQDAVSDFVKVGMAREASACVSDHAKILFQSANAEPDYGAVGDLVSGVLARLERRFELPDVAARIGELAPIRRAVDRVVDACNPKRWDVYFRVREAIDGLRGAAGPGMIRCLIRWRDV